MNFDDFLYISELGFLIEAPVITTSAVGSRSKYIDPSTGKSWRKIQKTQQLEAIKEEHPEGSLYVHFTDGVNVELNPGMRGYGRRVSKEPKLGVNPRAESGGTPIGIYAYPIDYVIEKDAKVPYGDERKFLLVFKVKRKNILYANNDKKEITDLDEIIELLQRYTSSTMQNVVEKQTKHLKEAIKKINSSAKKELKKEIPANIVDFIFEILESKVYSWLAYTYEEYRYLKDVPNKIKKLSNFYKEPELYFSNYSDDDKKAYIDSYLIKIYKNLDNWWSRINFEELTFTLVDENEEVIKDENGELIKDISILEKFKDIQSYGSSTKTLLNILSSEVIKKYSIEQDSIFKKFEKRIIKIADKLSDLIETTEKEKEQKISNFNFPFKEEFIKIAEEYNLDLLKSLKSLLRGWSSSSFGANSSTNASNFVYKFTGLLSQEIANKTTRRYYVVWTELLRKIGFKGIVDDEGSSTIHSSEPTQSVFFDAKQLELVGIVKNHTGRAKWTVGDSPFLRWQKGILNSMQGLYYSVHIFDSVRHANGLMHMFERVSKITMYLQSYFRFSEQIEKEKPGSIDELKKLLRSMLIRDGEQGSFSWFLNNYEKVIEPIKEQQELLKYANILRETMEKISQFIKSPSLKTDLPKPSQLRGIVLKLTNMNRPPPTEEKLFDPAIL